MKHTAYKIPVLFAPHRRMSNENLPQPNPTPNDTGSLWEAGKEVVQDAINYSQQTAYNLGVNLGMVDPSPSAPQETEVSKEIPTENPETSQQSEFHKENQETEFSQPSERPSSMLPKSQKHFPIHRRPKQPAESHHAPPAEVSQSTGNKPQKSTINRRPKQPAESHHAPPAEMNPTTVEEAKNVVPPAETNPTPVEVNTETKPQKHNPIHRRPKQPAEPHHAPELPNKTIE